jgi:Integrase core domain
LKLIRPGKLIEKAYIESFNVRVRDECLNEHWFLTREDYAHDTGRNRSNRTIVGGDLSRSGANKVG